MWVKVTRRVACGRAAARFLPAIVAAFLRRCCLRAQPCGGLRRTRQARGDCDFKLRTVSTRALCSVRLHSSCTPVALRTTYAGPHCILGYPFVPPLLRYWYEGGRARRSNAAFCRKGYSVFHCVLLWHAVVRRWEAGRTAGGGTLPPPHRRRSNARLPSYAIVPHPAPRRVRSAILPSALTVRRPGGRPLHTLTYAPTCSPPESAARPAQTRRVHLCPPCRQHPCER